MTFVAPVVGVILVGAVASVCGVVMLGVIIGHNGSCVSQLGTSFESSIPFPTVCCTCRITPIIFMIIILIFIHLFAFIS